MKRLIYLIPLTFLLSLFFPRCAVIVPPTGGDKDTIPPVMVRSVPPVNSTNFSGERIIITFDEFIRLDQITQKMVLSPPQEQLPEFRVRGKSLELKFFETLLDSTTYTLYFADAIVDNNEGNKLLNFEFAFSTGPIIDSLRFIGKVIDAFTLEPKEGIFVMLYAEHGDSVPILQRPRYVTKSNKEGHFFLSNLNYDNFKIFALKDGNTNYKFDQITEEIAFSKTLIDTSMLLWPSRAIAQKDSLYMLRLFLEENRAISLTDFSRKQRRRLSLGFTRKPEGDVKLRPINFEVDSAEVWFELGRSARGDTLHYWITNNELSKIDTLRMVATYLKTDSLMNLVETSDTLRMFYLERTQTTSSRRQRQEDEEVPKKQTMPVKNSLATGGVIIPYDDLKLSFNIPLRSLDSTHISIMNLTDSTYLSSYDILKDSLDPLVYSIKNDWQSNISYKLNALPGAFTNLDGVTNDTLIIRFKGADPEQFGSISLSLTGVTHQIIAQVITDRGVVVDSKTTTSDGVVKFSYVRPGKYLLRFIVDENMNGRWDTGWYLQGIQPERVLIYEDANKNRDIQVRANWEYELNYKIN